MAKVTVALKPKYATRKATDKVIFNEGKFLTVLDDAGTSRRVLSLLDTCHVSYVVDDKYYPVDKDSYEEQYDLVAAEEAPTVEEDEKFGTKKIECFISAPEQDDMIDTLQVVESFANGIFVGSLYKVVDYKEGPDAENVTNNGYWLVFNFDKAGAEEEGYSELKLMGEEEELADGNNYVFMGATEEEVSKKVLAIVGKLTVEQETGDVEQAIKNIMKCTVLGQDDAINAVEIDGVAYDTLYDAFQALVGKGGDIYVNKSCAIGGDSNVVLKDGKTYNLHMCNGATVTIEKYMAVRGGNTTLNILGNGTLKEEPCTFAAVGILCPEEEYEATLYIDEGITLIGANGLAVDKASYNCHVVCHGTCIAMGNSSNGVTGGGIYVNGNVKDCDILFTGKTGCSNDTGMYIAGNADVTVSGATVEGSLIGIEQRAGSLKIVNSRITGGMGEPSMKANGNGTTSANVALVIAQHTTNKPIYVNVDDASTFIGGAAFYEGNPQQNPEATENTHLVIEGGAFAGPIKTMSDTDCTKFLYGGHYSEEPDAKYIADGYEAVPDTNGTYNVVKKA